MYTYLAMLGPSCGMQDFQLQHVGSSSLIRDGTCVLSIGSEESQALDTQGCFYADRRWKLKVLRKTMHGVEYLY